MNQPQPRTARLEVRQFLSGDQGAIVLRGTIEREVWIERVTCVPLMAGPISTRYVRFARVYPEKLDDSGVFQVVSAKGCNPCVRLRSDDPLPGDLAAVCSTCGNPPSGSPRD